MIRAKDYPGPSPVLGWCGTGSDGYFYRHKLRDWGDWKGKAPSLTHGRQCVKCGRTWGWVYTTHHCRLMEMSDPEAINQMARNKRITPHMR